MSGSELLQSSRSCRVLKACKGCFLPKVDQGRISGEPVTGSWGFTPRLTKARLVQSHRRACVAQIAEKKAIFLFKKPDNLSNLHYPKFHCYYYYYFDARKHLWMQVSSLVMSLLQLSSLPACSLVVLPSVLPRFCLQQGKCSSAQVIDMADAKHSTFLFWKNKKSLLKKKPLSKFALGHCPSSLSSSYTIRLKVSR